MSPVFDLVIVILSVGLAIAYLARRNLRTMRKSTRDWTTGHNEESCSSCPVVQIRKLQQPRDS
jgi:hypothetical protein